MRSDSSIALVSAACRYPDADTPAQLLANTLAGRQSFREIPPTRLALDDYAVSRVGEADSITHVPAGMLTGWQFNLARFRIPRRTFESTDLTHWLALEVAADAIEHAGGIDVLDRTRTAVVVANTLTGEFSRTAQLRLRWPWLDRMLIDALRTADVDDAMREAVRTVFRDRLTDRLRAPDEDTLAGGLANTIAGRISNFFDLKGGCWSVDAACASSLVAVAEAAELILSGRSDTVIVAAVDLSLDPFELVGFSRNGALAPHRMRVFDASAEGFWPGEGAGAVLLMRSDLARSRNLPTDLELAGWGVASDGRGGLTRPEVDGQRRALEQAFTRLGRDPAELGYVEAHGTGTAIGDPTEVRALSDFVGLREIALPIASIKGNIGHAKAAAGLAGLIRTAEALRAGIVPPHAGCEHPHPVFAETGKRVRVATAPEAWPEDRPLAGVSSFGFGGVNAHVLLARSAPKRPAATPAAPAMRDAEIFMFSGPDRQTVDAQLIELAERSESFSFAEIGDAAARAARNCMNGRTRLAFLATTPRDLTDRIAEARTVLSGHSSPRIFFGEAATEPRIGFAFPGQASPVRLEGGAWARRFPDRDFRLASAGDPQRTDIAQPAVIASCLQGLEFLDRLGVQAVAAIGHSLGELAALGWANALPRAALPSIAAARGAAMAGLPPGAMLRLACPAERAASLVQGFNVTLACFNTADEVVAAGDFTAIDRLARNASDACIDALRLQVSHAFHTPAMAGARPGLAEALANIACTPTSEQVASTVTGDWLAHGTDVRALLLDQLEAPVLWDKAARLFAEAVDVVIEVGPGAGMSRLLAPLVRHVHSLDVSGDTMVPALEAVARVYALGARIDPTPLFDGPEIRPLPDRLPEFLANPCGPVDFETTALSPQATSSSERAKEPSFPLANSPDEDPEKLLIRLLAEDVGLPESVLSVEDRFLDDLHLNSLSVSRLLTRFGDLLGRRPPSFRTAFSNACVREVAGAFAEAEAFCLDVEADAPPAGPAPWVRRFIPAFEPTADAPAQPIFWRRAGDITPPADEDGLLITLPPDWDAARNAPELIAQCQAAVGHHAHLAIRHHGAPLSGFVRSIAAERLFVSVRLIEGPEDPDVLSRAVADFEELVFRDGQWLSPCLALDERADLPATSLKGSVLVTGGARGIAAECAIHIATRWRMPLILVGRSDPAHAEVAVTLARLAATGVRARYVQADVADAAALATAVALAAGDVGPPALLIHAAGVNEPMPFARLEWAETDRTLRTKVNGLRNAVEACGPSLGRIVAFGSIISHLGLAGEAHYALANAEQSRLLASMAQARPGLSTLSIDWSVWAGVGMGERLGTIERLRADGVEVIALEDALDSLEALVLAPIEGVLVIAGRHGMTAALPSLECGRFLERVLVHTPGVELVVETELSRGRDRYLDDHIIDDLTVFPGVMMLEAMAQAAAALSGPASRDLVDIRFTNAIICEQSNTRIRTGVLREPDGSIRAEVRWEGDNFTEPAAEARFIQPTTTRPAELSHAATPIEAASLYGTLFFQGRRFQRIAAIGKLTSRHIAARLEPVANLDWFSPFELPGLALDDPGVRDAALHALQCCVPHHQLIPIAAKRIERFAGGAPSQIKAEELWCRDGDYCFNITVMDEQGCAVERWQEATFRVAGSICVADVLAVAPALVEPWLERCAREETGDTTLRLALVDDPALDREQRRMLAAARLGFDPAPARRSDGRPACEAFSGGISFAHADGITLAVASAFNVGCDLEPVAAFNTHDEAVKWVAEETLRKLGRLAPMSIRSNGHFTGTARERIVPLGPVQTQAAGFVAVAVGVAPQL